MPLASFTRKVWKNRDDPTLRKGTDPDMEAAEFNRIEQGIADAIDEVNSHSLSATGVHGIADTALLETHAGAQAKVDAAGLLKVDKTAIDTDPTLGANSDTRVASQKALLTALGNLQTFHVYGTVGAAVTLLDVILHDITLDQDCVVTMPTPAAGHKITVIRRQDAEGQHMTLWPASVQWPNGVAPLGTGYPGTADIFEFLCSDGAIWVGKLSATDSETAPVMPNYLFRDLFTTAVAGPLPSPHNAEPGPGAWTVVNALGTAEQISISGGRLIRPRPTGGQGYDKYGLVLPTPFARRPGLTVFAKLRTNNMDRLVAVSWSATPALPTDAGLAHILFGGTGSITAAFWKVGLAISENVDYIVAIVCRANGYLFFIRGGTEYPRWTLLHVDGLEVTDPLYVTLGDYNSEGEHDAAGVIQKYGRFADDFAANIINDLFAQAAPYAYDTTTPNFLAYVPWTPVAGETFSIRFRRDKHSGDADCYRLDCAQAGGTIKLYRRVAGVDTELAAGKVQVWTPGKEYRIGVVCDNGTILTVVRAIDATAVAKHAVTGETVMLDNTGLTLAGFTAIGSLEVFPRFFDGDDEASLA